MNGPAVGGSAGHAGKLQGNALLGGGVDDQIAQFGVGNHARVEDGQAGAAAQPHARLLFLDAGHVAGDVGFDDDGHVGVDGAGAGGGAAQADFFHDGLHAVEVVGVGRALEVAQNVDDDGAADAVVEGLGEVGLAAGHDDESAVGHDGVAHADAGGLGLGFVGGADVDVHVLFLDHLAALVGREQVGGLGPDDADDVAPVGLDDDALGEEGLIPPAAELEELEEAVVVDVGDDEADLVHVAGEHDAGAFTGAMADEAAELVLGQVAQRGHVVTQDGADLGFIAGYAVGLRQCLQKLFGLIHVVRYSYI